VLIVDHPADARRVTTFAIWSLARGCLLDQIGHFRGVRHHGKVTGRNLHGGRSHATREQPLGIGWDRLILRGDQIPRRQRLPGGNTHHVGEHRTCKRLPHGVQDLGPGGLDAAREVRDEVFLGQPPETLIVVGRPRQGNGVRSAR
jgi:hypothetical protein